MKENLTERRQQVRFNAVWGPFDMSKFDASWEGQKAHRWSTEMGWFYALLHYRKTKSPYYQNIVVLGLVHKILWSARRKMRRKGIKNDPVLAEELRSVGLMAAFDALPDAPFDHEPEELLGYNEHDGGPVFKDEVHMVCQRFLLQAARRAIDRELYARKNPFNKAGDEASEELDAELPLATLGKPGGGPSSSSRYSPSSSNGVSISIIELYSRPRPLLNAVMWPAPGSPGGIQRTSC